ncbi:MAG: conjugal transfer protein [Methylococcales bacterium]|nr:conjugal transfer protein [Methylococcales bacterium]
MTTIDDKGLLPEDGLAQVVVDADAVLDQTRELNVEQITLLGLEQSEFTETLDALIEEKKEQVEHLENKLEDLIESQNTLLEQTLSQAPGILSLPRTKANWTQRVSKIRERLQTLNNRLESVHEIKDGMHGNGLTAIERMAHNKLAFENPDLVEQFQKSEEILRRHQALTKQTPKSEKKQGKGLSLSQAQGF